MRAIIVATGYRPAMDPLNQRYPTPLLPLVDRPFVQHVVEYLVEQGCTEFDFLLSHLPHKLEDLLGDGARWGVAFRHHLVREPDKPYGRLRAWRFDRPEEPVLLVHGDRLPPVELSQHAPAEGDGLPVLFCTRAAGDAGSPDLEWCGWGWVSGRLVSDLPDDLDEAGFAACMMRSAESQGRIVETAAPLSVRSFEDLLEAHCRVLGEGLTGLMLSAREAQDGVWLSRNVSLHPTATIEPPAYIGANCRISAGVRLGPNAVLGHDCVLDRHCTVRDSAVFPGSYVGEALDLREALVDRNCLVSVRAGASLAVADDFILGSLSDRPVSRWVRKAIGRLGGLCLLVAASPAWVLAVVLLKLFRRGPVLYRQAMVRLPAPTETYLWRTFLLWRFVSRDAGVSDAPSRWGQVLRHLLLRFLPGLVNVVRGEMSVVGVEPRTAEDIQALPPDWRALYLRSKAGIVTEAFVEHGEGLTEDGLYSAESFYSVSAGLGHDLKLFVKYLLAVVNPFAGKGAEDRAEGDT